MMITICKLPRCFQLSAWDTQLPPTDFGCEEQAIDCLTCQLWDSVSNGNWDRFIIPLLSDQNLSHFNITLLT